MPTPEQYLSATWAGSTGYEIAMLAVTVMFMLAGIALGLGIAFRSRWLSEWGKGELTQSMINGALVGGLITLFGAGGVIPALMNSYVPSSDFVLTTCNADQGNCAKTCENANIPENTPMCYALKYLQVLMNKVSGTIGYLIIVIPLLSMLSSIQISIFVASFMPFSGLGAFVTIYSHVLEMLVLLSVMLLAQVIFLKFIYTSSLTVLLPTGLVLRSFFMTRRLGGALMAIAIGLAVVFPLTFVLDGSLLSQDLNNMPNATQENDTLSSTITNATTVGGLVDYNSSQTGGVPDTDAFQNKVNASQASTDAISFSMSSVVTWLTGFIADLAVMVVILPLFNIIVTMIAVKELAALFGAEIGGGKFEPF